MTKLEGILSSRGRAVDVVVASIIVTLAILFSWTWTTSRPVAGPPEYSPDYWPVEGAAEGAALMHARSPDGRRRWVLEVPPDGWTPRKLPVSDIVIADALNRAAWLMEMDVSAEIRALDAKLGPFESPDVARSGPVFDPAVPVDPDPFVFHVAWDIGGASLTWLSVDGVVVERFDRSEF